MPAKRNIAPIKSTFISKYSVIIPAAGEGQRMKSYGPKPLLKLSNTQNLIEYQINTINKVIHNAEIILVSGLESDRVMNNSPSNVIKIENERYSSTNVARSIAIGLRAATTDNIVIIYGDLLFNINAIKNIYSDKSFVVIDSNNGYMSEEEVGCFINKDGYVENISYGLTPKWAQIIYLCGKELKLFKQEIYNREHENMYGFEILNKTIDRGAKYLAICPKGIKISDIDSSKDLLKIKDII